MGSSLDSNAPANRSGAEHKLKPKRAGNRRKPRNLSLDSVTSMVETTPAVTEPNAMANLMTAPAPFTPTSAIEALKNAANAQTESDEVDGDEAMRDVNQPTAVGQMKDENVAQQKRKPFTVSSLVMNAAK